MPRPYTMPELKAVRAAVLAGSTVRVEAQARGRDPQAMSRALRRSLGFSALAVQQARRRKVREQARAIVAEGYLQAEAALEVGAHINTVQRAVNSTEPDPEEAALPAWLPRCTPRVMEQLDLVRSTTRSDIASALSLSISHVGRVLVMLENAGLATGEPRGVCRPNAWTLTVAGHQACAKLRAS